MTKTKTVYDEVVVGDTFHHHMLGSHEVTSIEREWIDGELFITLHFMTWSIWAAANDECQISRKLANARKGGNIESM